MGNITTGMSIFANGGMNTRYNLNLYANAFDPAIDAFAGVICGKSPIVVAGLGVNLSQVIIPPTVATKLNQDHSIGASVLLDYQRTFRLE